jgi:hypothetical protein
MIFDTFFGAAFAFFMIFDSAPTYTTRPTQYSMFLRKQPLNSMFLILYKRLLRSGLILSVENFT